MEKAQGLHFGARTATLEQLEEFSIEQLAQTMRVSCPYLSDLLVALLDANSVQRWCSQPEMECTDDEGSVMSEEEEESSAKKWTDLEHHGDEHWEEVSNSDSDSDDNADGYIRTEDMNHSDSDMSMQSTARSVDSRVVPEIITTLPEWTSISPDAMEEQAEKMKKKTRCKQDAAHWNRLLISIVCLSFILVNLLTKSH